VKANTLSVLIAVVGTLVIGADLRAQKLYRWVDENGVVHYGDRVPPEYANLDRDLLNQQAVEVGFEEGALSAEERSELEKTAADREAQRRADEATARRDRMLLDTYLSVEDIEELRDRRIELLESQIEVTEQYIANLENQLKELEREAERFRAKRGSDENAALPHDLDGQISRTRASISLYHENLERTRIEQDELRAEFAADIDRFIELTGGQL
jgi:hypothetical protein